MDDCVFHSKYRDHGASMDTCVFNPKVGEYRDLCADIQRYSDCCPCLHYLTIDDVRNLIKEKA